jgi:zinc transport system substrate-binding protein
MLHYNITKNTRSHMHPLPVIYILLLLLIPLPALSAPATVTVAVTVKPIHSLVTGIMKGAGEPVLVMSSSASPHHYTLRPSERRALAEASLIFWVGPELETFMPRVLDGLQPSSTTIALIESAGLLRLPARTTHHHATASTRNDPHIWLSAQNAHTLVDAIADELARADAAHADIYNANRTRLHQRIAATDKLVQQRLAGKSSAFLTYHDAYQYFEQAYGLNNAGFVSSGDELSPSAGYVKELRDKIRKQQLHCLFYEAPTRPGLVDTLTHGLDVKVQELDAIGLRVQPGENAWFEIMLALAQAYDSCL